MNRRSAIIATLLTLVAAAGCGGDVVRDPTVASAPAPVTVTVTTPSPEPPSPPVETSPLSLTTEAPAPPPDDAEARAAREQKVLADAEGLEPLLNAFWTRELAEVYGVTFDPPERFAFYRGGGNDPCGTDTGSYPNNAFYCPVDDDEHVQFDMDWFQGYLDEHPGGATTFLILAHEWGHAVQDSWLEAGGGDVWDPGYTQELNADCLAGVFIARSLEEGTIVEDVGDSEAIFGWLYESGSDGWLEVGDHGTREQRQAAFSDGFNHGTDHCRTNY